ncbi:MAG: hypothetical protein ACYC8T_36385, partial [Myxococcaceae bacterium]
DRAATRSRAALDHLLDAVPPETGTPAPANSPQPTPASQPEPTNVRPEPELAFNPPPASSAPEPTDVRLDPPPASSSPEPPAVEHRPAPETAASPPEVTAPEERPARAVKKTYFGIGARAFFIPAENRWGPAPELSVVSVRGGFKSGAVVALLAGDTLCFEVAARMSGGPSLGRGISLDFGGELGLIVVPSKTALTFDLALNVVAASMKAGPALISVRLFSPTLYLGVTSTGLITRFGYQGGFTVAF